MTQRSILCVMPRHSADIVMPMRDGGWDVHVAADLKSAHRLLLEQQFLVGLLIPTAVHDRALAELDDFAQAHDTLEWVGAFEAQALESPSCRDFIIARLFDHHTLPVDMPRLMVTVGHALGHAVLRLRGRSEEQARGNGSIVGHSDVAKDLLRTLRRIAKVEAPVLICGESGSGKELAAQEIHRHSSRANGPFVAVNCGAIQPSLIQSQLFGHVKGAFTGASRDERGFIESASGGTIFLDEIGDLSLDLQINLLRFLQEKTITRVGSTRSIEVDVRVIAATHVDLDRSVATGAFREDLFYRLNVLAVTVPPLRARKPDIELLAQHFFAKFGAERSPQVKGFSQRALAAMAEHSWPGNVRELINRVRRAMVMCDGRLIAPLDLDLEPLDETRSWDGLDRARRMAERNAISSTLLDAGTNISEAARKLGVSRMTLYRLMAKHGIEH